MVRCLTFTGVKRSLSGKPSGGSAFPTRPATWKSIHASTMPSGSGWSGEKPRRNACVWTGLRISCAKPAQALCDCYVELLGRQRYILSGAEEFCRAVSARMPIYLITNGISQIQRSRFGDCAITPYLSGMVISEEVGHAKPHPAMLYQALEMAGCAPQEAIVMGDSVTADIAAANAAGVESILFTEGKEPPEGHGATYVARTYREALDILLAKAE